ncbi:hypothetical protein GT030_15280 [Streptomyces sp. SID1328]|uniref:hypothetical protein n=1 Tax=Streptomyces sp. SID1328 TaxID=2690250 RepID=UPI00136E3F98|nr:hypothetical protein [Streptomyces sp. SID1328]MYV40188.1 hypothetical protein [Streptomyces sp. SID1328]
MGAVEAASRAHTEVRAEGTQARLGVWLSNVKTRRAGLSGEQFGRLAGLGPEWAQVQGQDSLA